MKTSAPVSILRYHSGASWAALIQHLGSIPKAVQCSGFVFIAFVTYIITTMCDGVLHCLWSVFFMFFWCPCMAINVNVQYNGGLLPDIILLTQCYLHRGTCLNAMKRFCIHAAFDLT